MISDFDELKLTEKLKGIYVQLNIAPADATSKVVTIKSNAKFLVAKMVSGGEPLKHFLRIFTFCEDFDAFVKALPQDHKFEMHIVDFCFNPDGTWLVICLQDGTI